jgi:hypothetical protein
MIAEDYNYSYQPNSSIPKGTSISCIIDCFKKATPFFKKVLVQPNISRPLNENKLTQIFVEQLKIQLLKIESGFEVANQYSDIFFGAKGIPDFYFYIPEEGKTSMPLFIVEAKRLPAYMIANEKEYVKGTKLNGGIERFKIEKHGKGLLQCGMLGFIENEDVEHWLGKINEWIEELSNTTSNWLKEELLTLIETNAQFACMNSIAHAGKRCVTLHHFWIQTT